MGTNNATDNATSTDVKAESGAAATNENIRSGIDILQKLDSGAKLLLELDPSEYEIGATPKEEVFRCDSVRLYRYRPLTESPHPIPVLITYAMFGRYTMIDLDENLSMVRKLLLEGLDVYVIDWGVPNRSQRWLGTDDFVNGYISSCVDVVCQRSGYNSLNLLGICQGGTFSICYAALHPEKVKNLILLVTPVDLHADIGNERPGAGYLNLWTRASSDEELNSLIDAWGMVPPSIMATTFGMMNPIEHIMKYFNVVLPTLDDREKLISFLQMERWIADRPPYPGELMREFLRDLYKHNRLIKGEMMLGQKRVDLSNIRAPILNIFASDDSIVPPACSRGLAGRTSTCDYTEIEVPGGHIGVFVGKRAQKVLAPSIIDWIKARG